MRHLTCHVWCKKGLRGLLYSALHVIWSKVRVPLGLLDGFVAKKFSHGEKVYPILDSMASEGMAEHMEGNSGASQLSFADKIFSQILKFKSEERENIGLTVMRAYY